MLVTNLTNNLFHQVFNRDQSGRPAVLVDNDGHLDVAPLHFPEEFTAQLAFRNEINIFSHQALDRSRASFRIRNL